MVKVFSSCHLIQLRKSRADILVLGCGNQKKLCDKNLFPWNHEHLGADTLDENIATNPTFVAT